MSSPEKPKTPQRVRRAPMLASGKAPGPEASIDKLFWSEYFKKLGEVAAGIVYKTEIHGIADVDVLDELAQDRRARPEVVAAVTTGSHRAVPAKALVDFLVSSPAQRILHDFGFGSP